MNRTTNGTARLAWGLLLLVAGAALATWGLSRWDGGARFFGVAPRPPLQVVAPPAVPLSKPQPSPSVQSLGAADASRIATLETRLANLENTARAAVEAEDFTGAMAALALLRAPIDVFFDKVTVNDTDGAVRARRLNLLARFRDAVHQVADFSKIEG